MAFSPDGAEVTYTIATIGHWNTMAVSVLGGEPRLVLSNASGLCWLDAHHVVFSEFVGGIHMGIVTATDTRADLHHIYLPAHERGMAHEGVVSPDRRWVIVVEMGPSGEWLPCRLVPFDGSAATSTVGPAGRCTSAAWSPDGAFMFFSADTGDGSHVWRQRFPNGTLEQITSGPGTERDVAMSRDGRLLTSVGNEESGLWMHDRSGERQVSSEGLASRLKYSKDGGQVFYLLAEAGAQRSSELWALDVASGRGRPIIQGFSVIDYDVSEDGRTIVFGSKPATGSREIWLAQTDHSAAPQRLTASGEDAPFFGIDGRIFFRASEGQNNYLFEMERDGRHRKKVRAEPIVDLNGHSADRRWGVAVVPAGGAPPVAEALIPLDGGHEQLLICPAVCVVRWSPGGERVYIQPFQNWNNGEAVMFTLAAHESLPPFPAGGIGSVAEGLAVTGASAVTLPFARESAVPGPTPDSFAYTRTLAHRNLFWVAVR